ncbi:hypothetical protein Scep_004219 [Stephania cephalantha]|uniref:Dirigent protein n=1 Tax=Stephania cephalantha TaxID=152367 RepID=A0AAP0PWG8_9MAGN
MQVAGCQPNSATYRMMADGFCRIEDFERGLRVSNAMLTSGHCLRVDTFCSLIFGFCEMGKLADPCFVLEEMERRKKEFNSEAWEALTRNVCKAEDTHALFKHVADLYTFNHPYELYNLIGLARNLDEGLPQTPIASSDQASNLSETPAANSAPTVSTPIDELGDSDEAPAVTPAGPPAPAPITGTPTSPPVVPVVTPNVGPAAGASATVATADPPHTLTFFMHHVTGGSNPSALAVTGITTNPTVNSQVPLAKPDEAAVPVNNRGPVTNSNGAVVSNSGVPLFNGAQLPSGAGIPELKTGNMAVIDAELSEGQSVGSGVLGKAQGFYFSTSIDGTCYTMAFTAMFESIQYVDSLNFFGVFRTAVSDSQLAIMGGTGKYVDAKGFASVKTIHSSNEHSTDGLETQLEFTVYLSL